MVLAARPTVSSLANFPVSPRKSRNKGNKSAEIVTTTPRRHHGEVGNPPMNTADEIATKIEPTKRRSADPVAGSGDMLHKFNERFRTLKDLQQTSAKPAENLSNKQLEELNERLDSLVRPGPQREPAKDLHNLALGIDRHLDQRTSEPTAIYHRLPGIENKMKKRSSRGFTRYLLAVCIGVAATLAWQSYGEAAKQMFAAKAPELGWSSETRQIIANWVEQLGWTKPPATHESTAVRSSATETPQAAPVAQTAPAAVAPSAPVAASIDPGGGASNSDGPNRAAANRGA